MKKLFFALIFIIYAISPIQYQSLVFANENKVIEEEKGTSENSLSSEYFLLADLSSNLFMYEKDSVKKIEPSGFSKILTAITVLDYEDDIYKKVSIPKDILEGYDYANRSIGLKYGEQITIYDMLRAMLVYDAGDCAIALAHCVGKSYDDFVALMNQTAKKAGAKNSNFLHPAGFKKDGQETTLRDLYHITKYALKNDIFSKIVDMDYIEIAPTNMHEQKRILFNTNEFLTTYYSLDHYNPDVYGVKSYYNSDKNSGVIAKYSDANTSLLILCAGAKTTSGNNRAYDDAQYLIEYAKENYAPVVLIESNQFMSEVKIPNGKNADNLLLINDSKIKTMLPKNYEEKLVKIDIQTNEKILAPIKKGDVMGKAIIKYGDKEYGEVNLLAYSNVEKSVLKHIKNRISAITKSATFKLVTVVFMLIFILLFAEKISKEKSRNKK